MEKKMKQIEFNLERALRIQNGEEEGKIVTRCGYNVCIVYANVKRHLSIIGLVYNPNLSEEEVCCFRKTGEYEHNDGHEHNYDLLLEIPLKQKQYDLKPFDKVLVRDYEGQQWRINSFSHYRQTNKGEQIAVCLCDSWTECIPYNNNTKHLVGTTNPFKY